MSHDEMIEVIAAHRDGKLIEARGKYNSAAWGECGQPRWDFTNWNYRVKPEPAKPREWWVNTYHDGGLAIHDSQQSADHCGGHIRKECVRVREVLSE